ncbi:MAG TPA: hypothetical protein VLK85_00265 [Ramlibacter sp.]|nr:hypothetical protein [Ramlibacter sp.]
MKSSAFVFGTDLLSEGYEAVVDNLQERAGLGGVSLSATYHDARDVFAHNPRFHVYRHEGDVAWFAPEPARYRSGLAPRRAAAAAGADVLSQLCTHAGRRGMTVDAWTIFLHNSLLAAEHPECATRNVYGDPYLADLCPANPVVRAYCRELAADVARYPVQRLMAESLHYRPLEHGEHHERYLIDLPAEARTLLSLCFCQHCTAAARQGGVAVDRLAAAVREALEPVWRGQLPPGHAGALLGEGARAELAAYVDVRLGVVAGLVAEVRQAMAGSGVALSFIDHAGAMSHVMAGTSADDEVTESSRKLGIDLAAVAAECDEIGVLGYVDSAPRLQAMLDSYVGVLGAGSSFSVALRPLVPDCRLEENLIAKVAAAKAGGAAGVDFYHYAMMPLNRLDWIRHALERPDVVNSQFAAPGGVAP